MIAKTKQTWLALGFGALLTGLASIACARDGGADLFGENFGPELRASTAPRDWALAADIVGLDGKFPSDRTALLAKAAAAAPDDTFVQWLALAYPKSDDATDAESADHARRLAASDPGNAAAWMSSLALAAQASDVAAVDEALERMAAAQRFDTHMRDYLFAWLDVYARRTGSADPTHGYVQSIARATSFALPAFRRLVQACDPTRNRGIAPARVDRCATVARAMTAANEVVTRAVGYAILRKTGRVTPEEADAERTLRWLQQNQKLPESDLKVLPEIAQAVADWRETGSELAVYRRRVQRAGIALTPPPGWDWRESKR